MLEKPKKLKDFNIKDMQDTNTNKIIKKGQKNQKNEKVL